MCTPHVRIFFSYFYEYYTTLNCVQGWTACFFRVGNCGSVSGVCLLREKRSIRKMYLLSNAFAFSRIEDLCVQSGPSRDDGQEKGKPSREKKPARGWRVIEKKGGKWRTHRQREFKLHTNSRILTIILKFIVRQCSLCQKPWLVTAPRVLLSDAKSGVRL